MLVEATVRVGSVSVFGRRLEAPTASDAVAERAKTSAIVVNFFNLFIGVSVLSTRSDAGASAGKGKRS